MTRGGGGQKIQKCCERHIWKPPNNAYYYLSGESKGYGLIKYVSSDASAQARHLLDGRLVGASHKIVCDWLDSSHVTFASLHSKLLYVDCLPANYRDNKEFKTIFSVEGTPCYCAVSGASSLQGDSSGRGLGCLDLNFECSSVCPILPGRMGI